MIFNRIATTLSQKNVKELIWSLSSKLLSAVSGILLLLLLPNTLTIEDYGAFSLFFSYIFVLQLIFGTVFIHSAEKDITIKGISSKTRDLITANYLLAISMFIFSSIVFLTLVSIIYIPVLSDYKFLFVIFTLFTVLWNLTVHIIEFSHRLFHVFLMYTVEYSIKISSILFLFFTSSISLENVLFAFLFSYVASTLIGLSIVFSKINLAKLNSSFPSKDLIMNLLKNSIPIGLTLLVVAVIKKVDHIMISLLFSQSDLGIYSLAADISKNSSIISLAIVSGTVQNYVNSIDKKRFYINGVKLFLGLNFPVIIFINLIAIFGIRILYSNAYLAAVNILHIISILPLIIGIQTFNQRILILKDKLYVLFAISFAALFLNVILNLILANIYGLIGIAIATVISYLSWVGLGTFSIFHADDDK